MNDKIAKLLNEQIYTVVGRECIYLIEVAMLLDDLQGLGANGACGAEYGYPSLFHERQKFIYFAGSTASPLCHSSK